MRSLLVSTTCKVECHLLIHNSVECHLLIHNSCREFQCFYVFLILQISYLQGSVWCYRATPHLLIFKLLYNGQAQSCLIW
uniref:Uncharacterized protein n=1 Tax=Pyxicephalus adspersus TaxID=30357 RepID=A0AAV3B3Z9_PYXAD|nr:TPA: hypothetical protein GDO54_001383 [Pyxicephalus adspersus]